MDRQLVRAPRYRLCPVVRVASFGAWWLVRVMVVCGREARRFLCLAAANLQLIEGEDCFVESRPSSSIGQRLFFVGVGDLS